MDTNVKKKNQNIFHSSVKIKTKSSREKFHFEIDFIPPLTDI